jgi:hypothetical protein
MAVGKFGSRTSLSDVVIQRVAVVRRRLADAVGQAAGPCMTPGWDIPDPAVVFTGPLHGPTDHGASVDDRR